jgi:hypothetical protein
MIRLLDIFFLSFQLRDRINSLRQILARITAITILNKSTYFRLMPYTYSDPDQKVVGIYRIGWTAHSVSEIGGRHVSDTLVGFHRKTH